VVLSPLPVTRPHFYLLAGNYVGSPDPPFAYRAVAVYMRGGPSAPTPVMLSLSDHGCAYPPVSPVRPRIVAVKPVPPALAPGHPLPRDTKYANLLDPYSWWRLKPSPGRPGATLKVSERQMHLFPSYKRTDRQTDTDTDTRT